MRLIDEGDPSSDIWIVGEAPGEEEEIHGRPFIGQSGQELNRMLAEAGIARQQCFLTNTSHTRPPGNDIKLFYYGAKEAQARGVPRHNGRYPKEPLGAGAELLLRRVQEHNPRLVIALGDTPLWALTGNHGITKWRGSVIPLGHGRTKILPTFHPAAILRLWDWRHIAVQDLRRAQRESQFDGVRRDPWRFIIRPSFADVRSFLSDIILNPRPFTCDGEMSGGHISCIGFATSKLDAICIPFLSHSREDKSYWTLEEEKAIVCLIRQVLSLKHSTFQNGAWDLQYIAKDWGYLPRIEHDTMVMQHVAFPGIGGGALKGKSLDFMASMYCENYKYWKDDGKLWDPRLHSEEQHWSYNCEDCVRTFEVRETLEQILHSRGLWEQYRFQMDRLYPVVVYMMLRGVKIDHEMRHQLHNELKLRKRNLEDWFLQVLGHPLNPSSTPQMQKLFYEDFRAPKIYHKDTKGLTLNEEALEKIMKKQPILGPLIRKISDYRTTQVFKSTFIDAEPSNDGRMRCSINLTGAETFRFSTSEDAFGTGMNMQNLPKERPSKHKINENWSMPNIRNLFRADSDFILFEGDLSGADAQIVAWEADDQYMKAIFREGKSLWTEGAREMYGPNFTHTDRQKIKQGGHATDYGATARTVATHLGITVHEAEEFQKKWFGQFPGIQVWQQRTLTQLMMTRQVQNVYGYKRFYFGRIDNLLPQALAWLCQSAVALTINHGLCNIFESFSRDLVQPLMQVHDSVMGQLRKDHLHLLPLIHKALLVRVPFKDPLVIPIDLKISHDRWGELEDAKYEKAA